MRKRHIGVLGVLALLCACVTVEAKLAAFHFETMVSNSYMIVVAKVDSITPDGAAPTSAVVRVLETWKGPEQETIRLSTDPTWTCDISTAKIEETVMLFIWCDQKTGEFSINYSGRGRMPIDEIRGRKCATFWGRFGSPNGFALQKDQNRSSISSNAPPLRT